MPERGKSEEETAANNSTLQEMTRTEVKSKK